MGRDTRCSVALDIGGTPRPSAWRSRPPIVPALLGQDAGLIGAGLLALEHSGAVLGATA